LQDSVILHLVMLLNLNHQRDLLKSVNQLKILVRLIKITVLNPLIVKFYMRKRI